MKKIITLLFATSIFGFANAQYNDNNHWDNNNRNDGYYKKEKQKQNNGNGQYNNGQLNREISQIMHRYDYQIREVRNNFFMNRHRKDRIIRDLINQRDREINMLRMRYNNNSYNHHDNRRNKRNHW